MERRKGPSPGTENPCPVCGNRQKDCVCCPECGHVCPHDEGLPFCPVCDPDTGEPPGGGE